MTNLLPAEDRLLVEREEEENSSYVLPDGAEREKNFVGKILAIGEKVKLEFEIEDDQETETIKGRDLTGKKILFERYGPISLPQFGKNLYLVRQQYVLALLN